ncbi:MAG: glycosyltransferase family 4 protein, partial [Bacteroidales bacterium]|nr:glycosyltransferase family 4 protein [Bacteroidales bacterium]
TGIKKLLLFTKKYLQRYDIKTAQNPDFLISNSIFVQQWVKTHYKRDSVVIYPPVEIDNFEISNNKEDYYITIGRLEPYKRFDVIIEAFKKNGKKLIVVGDGSMRKDLENKSLSNITFVGYKNKIEVSSLLRKAQAFIYAGVEDFGIVYIEALASGVPIIGYNGGALPEIIEDGKEGYLYSQQSVDELNISIEKFFKFGVLLTPHEIREKSKRFSKEVFQQNFEKFISENS